VPKDENLLFRELSEQADAIRRTVSNEKDEADRVARLLGRRRIHFLGMGSSYFASLYGSYLLANLTHATAMTHLASEFVHYPSTIGAKEVCLALSQSGESIETVNTVRLLRRKRNLVIGVTNDPRSTLAKLSDHVLLTHAGSEKASSTKTFAATLAMVYCLTAALAARSKQIGEMKKELLVNELMRVSRAIDTRLAEWNHEAKAQSIKFANCRASLVLARGPNLPAALQGALLLKEVAKIPAEGMSSGEFTHGPVEILSRQISTVVLGGGRTSRLQHQLALRSNTIHSNTLMITPSAVGNLESICHGETNENLAVFPCVAILELLAYQTALKRKLDPDRFRFIHKVTIRE